MPACNESVKSDNGDITSKHTITGDDKKLVIIGDLVDDDIGKRDNDLFLWRQSGRHLVPKIANRSGHGKFVIDAAALNETAGRSYSNLLLFIKST
jgi:hypothetical protein